MHLKDIYENHSYIDNYRPTKLILSTNIHNCHFMGVLLSTTDTDKTGENRILEKQQSLIIGRKY